MTGTERHRNRPRPVPCPRPWLIVLTLCVLCAVRAVADDSVGEVLVSGMRPGPRLWQVTREGATLWILGTVSPLPVGVSWRSAEVEGLLAHTDTLLADKPIEVTVPRALWILFAQRRLVMNQGGRKLRDVLPAALYTQFAVLRSRFTTKPDKWEHYRPIIAAALLEDEALKNSGLSTRLDVSLTVRRLARRHRVPTIEVRVPDGTELLAALETISPDAERQCFAAILRSVEGGLPALKDRADAWASGDVERIRATPESNERTCERLLSADSQAARILTLTRNRWLVALEDQLHRAGNTLAVVDMDLLLAPDGLLESLRAAGYSIAGP